MRIKIDRISILSFIIGIMICDPLHWMFVKIFTGGGYYLLVLAGLLWIITKVRFTTILQKNMFICFCVFSVLMSFYYQLFSSTDIRSILGINIHGYLLYYIESFLAICAYFFIENTCDHNEKQRLINAIVMILLINCIVTILACLVDPNISRTNAMGAIKRASQIQSGSLLTELASTYSFAAEICVMLPFLLANRKKDKRIYIVIAMMLICTAMMGFTIMTFCALITIAVFGIYQSVEKKQVVLFMFIIVFIILCFINLDDILYAVIHFLREFFPNVAYIEKLSDIYEYLVYGTEGLALTGRMTVYLDGVQSFLQHPLFGNVITEKPGSFMISGHSSILDVLSLWGLIFGMPFIMFLHYLHKEMKKCLPLRIQAPVFVALLLLFFLNPTVQYCHIWFALFVAIGAYDVEKIENYGVS